MRAVQQDVVAIVGPGAVGCALASALVAAGLSVRLWSRTPGAAARARRRIGAHARLAAKAEIGAALRGAGVIVLAVADDAIEAAAGAVARAAAARDAVAVHTNGFAGPEALGALREKGLGVGVWHPLVPVAAGDGASRAASARGSPAGDRFAGAWFGIAGDARAREAARKMTAAIGARALDLADEPGAMHAYHAAASLASGGLVALLDAASGPFARAAVDSKAARAALLDLCARTLANLERLEPGGALTGAAARGSDALVAAHLRSLEAADPGAAEVYRVMARRMVAIARAAGRLDARGARRVLERLDDPHG